MSAENALEFMNKVSDDEGLQEQVRGVVGEKSGAEAIAAVTNFASGQGYDFTEEEVVMVREAIHAHLDDDGELSEDQLEGVAGGSVPTEAQKLNQLLDQSSVITGFAENTRRKNKTPGGPTPISANQPKDWTLGWLS